MCSCGRLAFLRCPCLRSWQAPPRPALPRPPRGGRVRRARQARRQHADPGVPGRRHDRREDPGGTLSGRGGGALRRRGPICRGRTSERRCNKVFFLERLKRPRSFSEFSFFLFLFFTQLDNKTMSPLSQLPTAFECRAPTIAPGGTVALTLRPGLRGENEPFELTVELLDEGEQGATD